MEIREIIDEKRMYMDLLLIGDEQEDMVNRYIGQSRLFIGYVGGLPVACCAVVTIDDFLMEVKNLAVMPGYRRKGIGRAMLEHVEAMFPHATIQLGTGETPSTLRFYRNCGYVFSHRVCNFFTIHYDHEIIEEGVRLRDMLYLIKRPIR